MFPPETCMMHVHLSQSVNVCDTFDAREITFFPLCDRKYCIAVVFFSLIDFILQNKYYNLPQCIENFA